MGQIWDAVRFVNLHEHKHANSKYCKRLVAHVSLAKGHCSSLGAFVPFPTLPFLSSLPLAFPEGGKGLSRRWLMFCSSRLGIIVKMNSNRAQLTFCPQFVRHQ